MAKSKPKAAAARQTDSTYFLKLVLYLVLGSQWLFLVDTEQTKQIPIPFGLIIGLLFASHDHFKIDRKIEYALLLIAALVGFWSTAGLLLVVLD